MTATENKINYIRRYNEENYDRINMLLPKGTRARWKEAARQLNISVTQLIADAVEKFLQKRIKSS